MLDRCLWHTAAKPCLASSLELADPKNSLTNWNRCLGCERTNLHLTSRAENGLSWRKGVSPLEVAAAKVRGVSQRRDIRPNQRRDPLRR